MRRIARFVTSLVTALAVMAPAGATAQVVPPPDVCEFGCPIIRPNGPVIIESYDVDVRIDSQVAVTHVTQVLRNEGFGPAEGVFLFPLPKGAAVTDLVLWIDNEPVKGDLLSKDEAREIYEQIVREIRDPALLEWVGHDLVQLSVFPIPEGKTRTVEVEYGHLLEAEGGLIRYGHPLGSEHGTSRPIENVTVRVEVDSRSPIRAIYSPTHAVDVDRDGERRFTATFEGRNVEPRDDFALFYSVTEDEIGIDVISYRDGDDPAGFFVMLVTPGVDTDQQPVAKDVILVLDRSGSMEGEKFSQAQSALTFILDNLNEEDRFNVVTFSSSIRSYAPGLRPASEADEAKRWVQSRVAQGATDINRALLEAFDMADDERPAYVIFLTDGLPTEGVTNVDRILSNAGNAARRNVSVFSFGVGFDVDAFLLDSLAQDHHGTASYVLPGENIDEVVSGFYAKVSSPVLTQIDIDFGSAEVFDTHPVDLPDLFAGEQLIVAGRYLKPGPTDIRLTGFVGDDVRSFRYDEVRFRAGGGDEFVPRLWATRKIGDLLREMRFEGTDDETVEQIVKLSTRYGIVTPFTSFLVTEPGMLGGERLAEEAEALRGDLDDSLEFTSGTSAVQYSDSAGDLAAAPAPTTTVPADGSASAWQVQIQNAAGRTFRLVEGVWIDTGFDPDTMTTTRVPFLSDDYFLLAAAGPALADPLALGDRVIVLHDGTAYEIVAGDDDGDPITVPIVDDDDPTVPDTRPPAVVDDRPGSGGGGPFGTNLPIAGGPESGGSGNGALPVALAAAAVMILAAAGVTTWRRRRT